MSTQLGSANVSELLAIQNTSTATLLSIKNSSTATQLAVQNTSTNAIRDSAQQNENFVAQLSLQSERIGSTGVVESKNVQVNQGRDTLEQFSCRQHKTWELYNYKHLKTRVT